MDNGEGYRRFLEGDQSALDDILELYQNSLIFFVHGIVKNWAAAEDIAADAFAALVLHPKRYNFRTSLKTYLFMLARSRALDWLRRQARRPLAELRETDAVTAELEEEVLANEEHRLLHAALARLNPDYQTALHLVYFENLSYRQTAKVMKKSEKQLENLVYRAKKALRTGWEKGEGQNAKEKP